MIAEPSSTREIEPHKRARGFTYYAAKDQAMVIDAAYGLMLWDGESKGTLNSVVNRVRQEKPVVYLAPKRTLQNLRSSSDLRDLLANCDRASLERFERELVRIQKTLEDASLKLTRVVSDILGTRSRTILKASVGGEAGLERLANLTTHRGSLRRSSLDREDPEEVSSYSGSGLVKISCHRTMLNVGPRPTSVRLPPGRRT